jgi:hypothetical protein
MSSVREMFFLSSGIFYYVFIFSSISKFLIRSVNTFILMKHVSQTRSRNKRSINVSCYLLFSPLLFYRSDTDVQASTCTILALTC